VRTIGTRNLVDAARAAGTRRIVAQSIAFGYQDGPVPATEDVTLRAELAGVADLESAVAELPEWVVLRYGLFYGPGSWYFPDGAIAERARADELVADESVTLRTNVAQLGSRTDGLLQLGLDLVGGSRARPASAACGVPEVGLGH
jgi:nucleoside-diphosphate-sugar epimerase